MPNVDQLSSVTYFSQCIPKIIFRYLNKYVSHCAISIFVFVPLQLLLLSVLRDCSLSLNKSFQLHFSFITPCTFLWFSRKKLHKASLRIMVSDDYRPHHHRFSSLCYSNNNTELGWPYFVSHLRKFFLFYLASVLNALNACRTAAPCLSCIRKMERSAMITLITLLRKKII